ncbi:VPLPA-CTERM sorting domain-containing protein [Roseobacter sp.]|uniref:poly(ethylene terephthalate) hydrolase family protein n=1 Tax=Roseobacter sp. TaxID=1907202 RepID=UPI00385AE89E
MRILIPTAATLALIVSTPLTAQNRIDGQSPDAPALSGYGNLAVGVRQIDLINPDQVDILTLGGLAEKPDILPTYDRPLTVEMWYPAAPGSTGDTSLQAYIRDGTTKVTLEGRAVRDAVPVATSDDPFPLVVMSHGYPGNRFLMSHLAENIASKGYVVASIDHTDSTYRDQAAFGSTLVNRSLDQVFVVEQMAQLNADSGSDFAGLIDADNTGLLGYSMGGYGAVITSGGGVTEGIANAGFAPHGTLGIHQAGSPEHKALVDPRIKTTVAIAPWGQQFGVWDEEGLAGIDIPMLLIGGSNDTVSQYETGFRKIWEGIANAERALLTFEQGSHNTAAPIPAPEESFYFNAGLDFNVSEHYTDPVWTDHVFMNNVAQHFITAWLDTELKGDLEQSAFLNLLPIGSEGIWSLESDGTFALDHSYWAGFQKGTAAGLRYEVLSPTPAPVPLPASAWMLAMAFCGLGIMRHRARRKIT